MTLDRLLRIAIWSVVLLGAVAAIAPFVTELSVLGVLFVGFVWLPFAAVLAVLEADLPSQLIVLGAALIGLHLKTRRQAGARQP